MNECVVDGSPTSEAFLKAIVVRLGGGVVEFVNLFGTLSTFFSAAERKHQSHKLPYVHLGALSRNVATP